MKILQSTILTQVLIILAFCLYIYKMSKTSNYEAFFYWIFIIPLSIGLGIIFYKVTFGTISVPPMVYLWRTCSRTILVVLIIMTIMGLLGWIGEIIKALNKWLNP